MSEWIVHYQGGPIDGLATTWPPPPDLEVPAGWNDDPERDGEYRIATVDKDARQAEAKWIGPGE